MATHHEMEISPVIRARCPLLSETAGHIGDVQVRNAGTIGGASRMPIPAADYPAALLALEAQIRLVSAKSDRTVAASDFFLDAFTTAIEPGEIVLEIQVPAEDQERGLPLREGSASRLRLRRGGGGGAHSKEGDRIAMARIGVTGMGAHAFRALAASRSCWKAAHRSPRPPRWWAKARRPIPISTLPPITACTWRAFTPRAHWRRPSRGRHEGLRAPTR